MKEPKTSIERSYPMIIASYWLSRCGEKTTQKPTTPPAILNVSTWEAAYNVFYDAFGDGRTPRQFRNSMKNARDTFDILFDNGRVGWIDRNGNQPLLSIRFQRVHDEWKSHSDKDLQAVILGLQNGLPNSINSQMTISEARTEGGLKVYTSVKYERDTTLRNSAIEIHGLNCMACYFDFEKTYGTLGTGFAEVHHMTPLANARLRVTNPKTDLLVLCSNCHRMVHRKQGICLSLDELKAHLEEART